MHHSCAPMTDTLFTLYIVPPLSPWEDTQRSNLPLIIAQEVWQSWGSNRGLFVSITNPLNHCILWLPGYVFD